MANRRHQREPARIGELLLCLEEEFPDARCALRHRNAFELLVATILSAQCTDERVNQVTPELFSRYPDAQAMSEADPAHLQEIIRSTGFFRNKARSLLGAAQMIVRDFVGEVPPDMGQLLSLPGVARKTANVVLGTWYGIADGVVVDTHVARLSHRLGLTDQKEPTRIEKDLMTRIPREEWISFSHRLILHGRKTCKARSPHCSECRLVHLCPYAAESSARQSG